VRSNFVMSRSIARHTYMNMGNMLKRSGIACSLCMLLTGLREQTARRTLVVSPA